METKKYVFSKRTTGYFGRILHQIKAITDFGDVKAGDLGGWIESEENLSQEGTCWVFDNAKVFDKARVGDEAEVFGEARVYGEAKVFDEACVCDEAEVFDKACVYGEAKVFDKACVYGEAKVFDKACVYGEAEAYGKICVDGITTLRTTAFIHTQYDFLAVEGIGSRNGTTTFYKTKDGGIDVACGCFRGSIEEFEKAVEKTHGDNEHGRVYKNIIQVAKQTLQSNRPKEKPINIKALHHREICSGLSDLYERKNHDYSDSFHETFLEEGWAMPRIRLGDKYRRFCALTSSSEGPLVKDETVRDTLLDLAGYAILTLLEIDCGLGATESITSKKGSEGPNPLTQTREEVEARDQTYYYLNELDPEKHNRAEIKFNLPIALQKVLNILREQKVNLALSAAKDCNRFVNEILRNEISKGGNRYELSIASCDLLASLVLLLTDMGYTDSQILEYIQDKWNREIKENRGE